MSTYSVPLQRRSKPRVRRNTLVLALALCLGLPLALITFYYVVEGGSERTTFLIFACWFLLFGVSYLEVFGVRSRLGYGGPAVLTYLALLELGLVPVWRVITGVDTVDGNYVKAMFLVAAGFTMFWIGSWATMHDTKLNFVPINAVTVERTSFMSALFLAIGLATNIFLWRAGLLSYLADAADRSAANPYLQWVGIGQKMLMASLVVSGIEVIGKKSKTVVVVLVFWISLACALVIGLVSAMKSEFLLPLVMLVLIYAMTQKRLPRLAFVIPLLLVVLYPFVSAYRDVLNNGYRRESTSVNGMAQNLSDAFVVAYTHTSDAEEGAMDRGMSDTSSRLSLLSCVRFIVGLPSPSLLNGDEKLWMAPVYPFIPRFLWHSKPVLNKGQRFSVAIGLPSTTSTAITAVGDFYIYGGTWGVLAGMLAYGVGLQLVMNWMGGQFTEKGLFFYLAWLPTVASLENDVVAMIAGLVSTWVIYLVLSNLVYGQGFFALHSSKAHKPAAS